MSSDSKPLNPPPPPAPPAYDTYQQQQYGAPNPNGYQPLYYPPPQQPGAYNQAYTPYQQQPYGQPYGQQAYPQYQTAYVATPQTSCHHPTSQGTGIGWILFIIGFFIPLCWLFGSFFICSSNPSDQRSGRANLTGFIVLVIVLTVFVITAST